MTPGLQISLDERVAAFERDGYTVFERALDPAWVAAMRARFAGLQRRFSDGDTPTHVFTDLIESEPALTLPAVTIDGVLDLAEGLIGPSVQLESITYMDFPPVPAARPGSVSGWHRDLFAQTPQDGVYHRPQLFNAAVYLQDLTEQNGPLRVIPGSHRRTVVIADPCAPHPEEVLLHLRAGDIVVFHCSLLHSGSPNRSTEPRYFFCMTYNHAWLKHRANYSGPVCQEIIRRARGAGDRRLLRLLGIDDLLFQRANSGFLMPDEERWRQWIQEDRCAKQDAVMQSK